MNDLEKRIEELEIKFKKLEELVLAKSEYVKMMGSFVEDMYKEIILHQKENETH